MVCTWDSRNNGDEGGVTGARAKYHFFVGDMLRTPLMGICRCRWVSQVVKVGRLAKPERLFPNFIETHRGVEPGKMYIENCRGAGIEFIFLMENQSI